MKMKTILVVDDEESIRKAFRKILERAGYAVLEASDGKEAIRQLDDYNPDLVVTDILMPEKDGIEMLLELRKKNHDFKVIALSGGGRLGPDMYLNYAEKLGAIATLEKPVTSKELLMAIKDALAIV